MLGQIDFRRFPGISLSYACLHARSSIRFTLEGRGKAFAIYVVVKVVFELGLGLFRFVFDIFMGSVLKGADGEGR